MSHYLDIKSLIDSDFYKKHDRLNWHLNHSKYDILTSDLYDWLNNIEMSKKEQEIFDISVLFIYTELASYITHVYDYLYLTDRGLKAEYSKQSNIYIEKIWNKSIIESSLLIELEKSRFRFDIQKKLYSLLVKFFPKKIINRLVVSSNDLSNQYLSNKKGISLKIFSQYFFPINLQSSNFSKNLSIKISNKIINEIESHYFKLNIDHKKSIKFIIGSFIARSHNNFRRYNDSLFRLRDKTNIITGTGYSYYNRLISSFLKKE